MIRWMRDVLFFAAGIWVAICVSFMTANRRIDSAPTPLDTASAPASATRNSAVASTELITPSAPAVAPAASLPPPTRKIVISDSAIQSASILLPLPPVTTPVAVQAPAPAGAVGAASPFVIGGVWPQTLRVPNSALFSGAADASRRKRQTYWNSPLAAILTQDGDQHRNKIGIAVPTNFDIELQPTSAERSTARRSRTAAGTRASGWFDPNENECTPPDDAALHLRQRIGLHRLPSPSSERVRIVVLIPWIDANPIDLGWFNFWLESTRINAPLVSWMLFTPVKLTPPPNTPANVHFIDITAPTPSGEKYTGWSDLFERKLKLSVKVPINAMHIKDLKPTFGLVFEDWTRDYTHFGFGDTDVIYGDLRRFLLVPDLMRYDIISTVSHDLPWMRLAGQLAVFKNTPLLKQFWRRNAEHEKQLSQVFEIYFDELHMPESLHIEQCVNWLLIWAQVSDLDHEQSGWQFQWQNGRLFALNPPNQRPPPEYQSVPPPKPGAAAAPILPVVVEDPSAALPLSSTLVTEAALLHFYRCKHRYQATGEARPSHPLWLIDVNRGAGINEMKLFTQTTPNAMLDLRGT